MTDTGKHTPGSWGVTKHIGSTQYEVGQEKNRCKAVAVVKTREDARLIAAAPDMAAALETAIQHIEHMATWIGEQNNKQNSTVQYSFESLGEDMPSIEAALTKAHGEGEPQ